MSTSMFEMALELELPALSVTEPKTDWSAPSPSVTEGGHDPERPEVASEHAKLTVGAPVEALYQPLAAGEAGVTLAAMAGVVVSTSMFEIPSEFELPALSVTVSWTNWFSPSPRVTEDGHAPARPEVPSEQLKLTVGAPVEALYQPLAASDAGAMLAVMVGEIVSTSISETVAEFEFPALSETEPGAD